MDGGAGNDFLSGDTGADKIIDFDATEDLLDLSAFGGADPLLSAAQAGNHVVFTFAGDTVTLLFTDIGDLDAGSFV